MDNKTANFAAIYFSIPKQEMRCYTWEQSRKSTGITEPPTQAVIPGFIPKSSINSEITG